jgi:hypothetical protein
LQYTFTSAQFIFYFNLQLHEKDFKKYLFKKSGQFLIHTLPVFTESWWIPFMYLEEFHLRTYSGPLTCSQSPHSPWLTRTRTLVIGTVEKASTRM